MGVADIKHGVKRKRGDSAEEVNDTVSVKLDRKLHHALTALKRTSKKVKTFETQKLVKKLKSLRQEDKTDEARVVEDQLEHLKHTNHERIAIMALRSKIKKDHHLSHNTVFDASMSKELKLVASPESTEATADSIRAAVESRLLSSKVLAQEVSALLQSLKLVLGVGDAVKTSMIPSAGPSSEAIEEQENEDDELETWDGLQADAAENDSVSGEVDDAGWESGSVDEPAGQQPDLQSDVSEDQGSDNDMPSDASAALQTQKKPKVVTDGKSKSSVRATESTFLPSLSVGFIPGDSDASDFSGDEADSVDGTQRKNRRGQRARKAIWEKKYGKNANHIKKQREEMQAAYNNRRDQGWPRGQGLERGGSGRGRGSSGRGRGNDFSSHQTSRSFAVRGRYNDGHAPQGNVSRQPTNTSAFTPLSNEEQRSRFEKSREQTLKPLHPSWEAKRKLKEKQSAAILPAQGTRIKFDL